jgi:hypothetical protein
MSNVPLSTDDDAVLQRLADYLNTQRARDWNQENKDAYWGTPEGWQESVSLHVRRTKAFLVLEQREDLFEDWTVGRFQAAARAWTPHLSFTRLAGEAQPKASDPKAAAAERVMATWRSELGPKAWVKAVMTPLGSHEPSILQKWLTQPNGLDWALQALKDGATAPSARYFSHAIHRHREDVVAALLQSGLNPNGEAWQKDVRITDLPLGMPVSPNAPDWKAVQRRIRETLVNAGADVNRLTGVDSFLHRAALQGDLDEVTWLLAKGADPFNGWTHEEQSFTTLGTVQAQADHIPHAQAIVQAIEQAQAARATPDAPTSGRRTRRSP